MSGLAEALRAIVARINGVFDDPDLEAFGPLADTAGDVAAIATAALAAHDAAVAAGGWMVDADGWRVITPRSNPHHCDTVQFDIPEGLDESDNVQHLATAERIVACVNACTGIADPAALVSAVRAVIEHCDTRGDGAGPDSGWIVDTLRDSLNGA